MTKTCRAAPSRAFTLVEVLYALAISSILGVGFLGAVMYQERVMLMRTSETLTRSQAETALLALQSAADRAGAGFGHANDAAGLSATGICNPATTYGTNWYASTPTAKCASRDQSGAGDRLRFAFLDPWIYSYVAPSLPSQGPCVGGGTDVSKLHFAEPGQSTYANPPTGLAANLPLILGGRCQGSGSPSAGTDHLILRDPPRTSGDKCYELRQFTRTLPSPSPANALSCPQGYAPGFSLGIAEGLEFYIDTDAASGLPALKMAQESWGQTPVTVAVGVTRFEARYGFDTSSQRDNKLHACPACTDDPYGTQLGGPYSWCREARASDQGGSCSLTDDMGVALGTSDLAQRLVAVHVRFDIVSPQAPARVVKALGIAQGVPSWTYQATLFLPNNAL